MGKIVELDVDGDAGLVKAELAAMADKLLANPVIETYEVEILDAKEGKQ